MAIEEASSLSVAVPRRAALVLGLAAATGLVAGTDARAEGAAKGVKITVLYAAPKSPAAFEKYYADMHMPMVNSVKEIKRTELAKGLPGPNGAAPAFYRITELWFDSAEQMQKVTGTPHWQKIVADVPNFATGGATILVSEIG